MNLTRCENGHFYDAERFDVCPHCNQGAISTVLNTPEGGSLYTQPLTPPEAPSAPSGLTTIPMTGTVDTPEKTIDPGDNGAVTIGYFGEVSTEPVVGWLVAIAGEHFGQDFKLKTGRNFVGRSANMDVSLSKDGSISREKHAVVLYEPRGNVFLVQPGDAKELFYLNDKVVLTATEINVNDVLSLGNTKLLFIPCCSEKFNWDSAKEANEK